MEKTKLDKALNSIKNLKIIVVIIIFFIIFQGVGTISDTIQSLDDLRIRFFSPKEILKDEQLKTRTIEVSQSILKFIEERNRNEPQVDFDNWDQSTDNLIKYSGETLDLYNKVFASEVIFLRNEYAKRGITDDSLDMFYEYPTNTLGIREVGIRLGSLAYRLD